MLPWTLQYAPKSTQEIYGQDRAVSVLKRFAADFKRQRKKALLLYGPPGSGKTSSVYGLAKELGHEILEVNASDFRDEARLSRSVGHASVQKSLFATSKILLVDEVEGIFGREDRGGVPTLVKLIKKTAFPLVLTTNNPWDKKFSPLRSVCELVEFKQLDYQTVLSVLRQVAAAEKIDYEERALASLARRAGGDIRGALIDLQTLIENGSFTMDQLELLNQRHQMNTIFNAILRVFKTMDAFIARMAFQDVEEDLNTVQLWIDENLPKEYTKAVDLAKAYEKISRADIFRGRIMRRQHWRFLAIINVLLSAGISLSKERKYEHFVKYTQTQRILKIWRAKMKYQKRASVAEKIAQQTHCSSKVALQSTLPYLKAAFMKDSQKAKKLVSSFDLNREEVAWLVGRSL
jgi:replication factor C large subunit